MGLFLCFANNTGADREKVQVWLVVFWLDTRALDCVSLVVCMCVSVGWGCGNDWVYILSGRLFVFFRMQQIYFGMECPFCPLLSHQIKAAVPSCLHPPFSTTSVLSGVSLHANSDRLASVDPLSPCLATIFGSRGSRAQECVKA